MELIIIFGLLCLIFTVVYIKNNNKIQNLQMELSRVRGKQNLPRRPILQMMTPPTTVVYEPSSTSTALVDALVSAQATIAELAVATEEVVVEEIVVEEVVVEEPLVEEFGNIIDDTPEPNDEDFDNTKNTFAYY